MNSKALKIPEREQIKQHVLSSLHRYWPENSQVIAELPINTEETNLSIQLPLRLTVVKLPEWANDACVDGELLIPAELLSNCSNNYHADRWLTVDWFYAAFLMLEAWHERVWEVEHGSIHSYSFRLSGWDVRFWQRAWVNRIALFLRLWAAHRQNSNSEVLFGPLPASKVLMTHDVDAIKKTLAIRCKQGAFAGINAVRLLARGKPKESFNRFNQALRFIFGQEDWWKFEELLAVEAEAEIQAVFHFYADLRPKTLKRWLFDPNYKIEHPKIKSLIEKLHFDGHQIGLHPSFESWNDPDAIAEQRRNLDSIAGSSVTICRQHWLRFSWSDTWASQHKSGMNSDTTLMFNDRSGFRNASAICWRPWNTEINSPHPMTVEPSVVMDSHLYDYQPLSDIERKEQILYWLNECKAVYGEMAVLWHPHTLTRDYGWAIGFADLLTQLNKMRQV
jgi:hypothetical protein